MKKDALPELSMLAIQAAMMLGLQAELKSTQKENRQLRSLIKQLPEGLIYNHEQSPMHDIARKIQKLAPTPLSVLILGETGTGKEVVARELHLQSARAQGPWVAINCAAIPATLLESTLFGYEKGAFTGANQAQKGKFQLADGGTLFLDEIGDLPLELQSKLLRVLQERVVEPVGATRGVRIDVRIIAATHQNLDQQILEGKFRKDLYFRLNGATLTLPPLRERKTDLVPLIDHFIASSAPGMRVSQPAMALLEKHSWPGNIRELEQVITRAALLSETSEIQPEDLDLGSNTIFATTSNLEILPLDAAQKNFTADYIQKVLNQSQGNRAETANRLRISERTLYRILASDSPSPPDRNGSWG